jgi:hypothetical protein
VGSRSRSRRGSRRRTSTSQRKAVIESSPRRRLSCAYWVRYCVRKPGLGGYAAVMSDRQKCSDCSDFMPNDDTAANRRSGLVMKGSPVRVRRLAPAGLALRRALRAPVAAVREGVGVPSGRLRARLNPSRRRRRGRLGAFWGP